MVTHTHTYIYNIYIYIYTLFIIIVIWDSPHVPANGKSLWCKLNHHHITFSTRSYKALIQKVKIRNDDTFVCEGAHRGPKFISTTGILYKVGGLVTLCQNCEISFCTTVYDEKTIFLIMLKSDDCSATPFLPKVSSKNAVNQPVLVRFW